MFGGLHTWLVHQYLVNKGMLLSYLSKPEEVDFPIDFVVTWVDEHDEKWRAEKNALLAQSGAVVQANNPEERYRDWETFKYWFRAVEKYAPWVRRVYLVTCGHIPDWLNTEAEKLVVVAHKEFMPEEYLPTFSSIPIELNLHRIPGLSEHFVYFNDDIILSAPVYPEDFFDGDQPRCCAITMPLKNDICNDSFNHQQFSNLGVFNSFWQGRIRQSIKDNPEKWFSNKYGVLKKHNLFTLDENYLLGMDFSHLAVPFCKRTFEQVWKDIPAELDRTCRHKFRTAQDIFHQIITLWDVVSAHFSPIEQGYYGKVFWYYTSARIQEIEDIFAHSACRMVCLNDTYLMTEEEYIIAKDAVCRIMQTAFPMKSVFEKKEMR